VAREDYNPRHAGQARRANRPGQRAFTLIELAAVLLILAVVAAAVTLRSHVLLGRAEGKDLVERIGQFDHLTRVYARRHDRAVRIVVDLDAGRLRRTDAAETETLGEALVLPEGTRIVRLRVRDQEMYSHSVSITCSRRGLTPTWAMQLEDANGRRQWLLLAGLSGRMVTTDNDDEIHRILAALGRGPDAD
jgi:prepilin-type N-terminal cleavage/methylation domain-containing protein